MMRDSSGHDTEGLLPKEQLSESEFPSSLPMWHRTSKSWREYVRENMFSVAVIIVLSISNIVTLFIMFFIQAEKQPYLPSINHPPRGVAPTFAPLVREPTPTFVNVSWYPPETVSSGSATRGSPTKNGSGMMLQVSSVLLLSFLFLHPALTLKHRWWIHHDTQRRGRRSRH